MLHVIIEASDKEIEQKILNENEHSNAINVCAMSFISEQNRDLKIKIQTNSAYVYNNYKSQIFNILRNYKPTKCIIRSYKSDDKFIEDHTLESGKNYDTILNTPDQYKYKNVVDVTTGQNKVVYKLFRFSEEPRILSVEKIE